MPRCGGGGGGGLQQSQTVFSSWHEIENCWLIIVVGGGVGCASLFVTRRRRTLLASELWLAEREGDVPVPDHVLEAKNKHERSNRGSIYT